MYENYSDEIAPVGVAPMGCCCGNYGCSTCMKHIYYADGARPLTRAEQLQDMRELQQSFRAAGISPSCFSR